MTGFLMNPDIQKEFELKKKKKKNLLMCNTTEYLRLFFVANLDSHTQYGSPLLQAQTTGVPSHAIPQCEASHLDKAAVVTIEINNKRRDKKCY